MQSQGTAKRFFGAKEEIERQKLLMIHFQKEILS